MFHLQIPWAVIRYLQGRPPVPLVNLTEAGESALGWAPLPAFPSCLSGAVRALNFLLVGNKTQDHLDSPLNTSP